MTQSNATSSWNADLIDEMHAKWIESPDSLDPIWKAFFEGFELGSSIEQDSTQSLKGGSSNTLSDLQATKQARFIGLIYAYRSLGHTIANFNPLAKEASTNPRLTLERLGFDESDLNNIYDSGNYLGGIQLSLKELIDRLEKTYCKTVGFEYLHIQETAKRRWIQARIEPECFVPRFNNEQKYNILKSILEAETFEAFLQSKFLGQKRFSLEGGETLIAILDSIFQRCGKNKVDEIVMGMAHRGRLNVLGNFLGKSFEYILREFSENYIPDTIYGDGDVKYHLGFETKRKTLDDHLVELRLAANPSHLEAVDPVVQGKARARQRIRQDLERKKVLPILIHGDAAIAGQGIVSEVFNFSQLNGYRTGGTIHIIVNNQIGFTTGPEDARSSRYCTDVAKIVEAPIFHVNCNDPLAVVAAVETAFDYRQTFGSDVVIDMYCYRKHGHNESDEPAFTQPVLYQKISNMPQISQILAEQLKAQGDITDDQIDSIKNDYLAKLEAAHNKNLENSTTTKDPFAESNAGKQPPYSFEVFETKVKKDILGHIVNQHAKFPEGFRVNRKIKRQLEAKIKAFETDSGIDWGLAESLAFGSLLIEGTPVRISGQDSKRGTFQS